MGLLEQHFDVAFAAPDGIKKLRELILTLAMQGKLVPQDPNDEPASELLRSIELDKQRLVKEGKIKQSKPLPEIKLEELPHVLPNSWKWVRLGEIVSLLGDGLHGTPAYDETGEYFFINGNNLSDGLIEIKGNTNKVSIDEYNKYKKELNSRTVLVSINGTIGNVAFYNNENVILGKSACYFNLFERIDKQFTKKLLNSPYFLEYAFSSANEIPPDSNLWLRDGDILVQRGNTLEYVGVSAVYRGEPNCFIYPDLMMKLRISAEIDTNFIYLVMSSEPCRNFLRSRASGTSGTMPKINQTTLKSLPIPLPPLAEQRRIVEKIDRLMGMCDRLEESIESAKGKQTDLLNALMSQV